MDGKEVTIMHNRKRSARATMKRPDHQRSVLHRHERRGAGGGRADWCVHAPPTRAPTSPPNLHYPCCRDIPQGERREVLEQLQTNLNKMRDVRGTSGHPGPTSMRYRAFALVLWMKDG